MSAQIQSDSDRCAISFVLTCGLALLWGLTGYISAQDLRRLKPLPRFLRNATVADRYLQTRHVDDVMRFQRVEPVCLQLIKRPGVPRHVRDEALAKLCEIRSSDGARELLAWIDYWDTHDPPGLDNAVGAKLKAADQLSVLDDLASMLPHQPRASLEQQRPRLVELASGGRFAATRKGALIALIQADASADPAWALAKQRTRGLIELLKGLEWLPSESPRKELYDHVRPIVSTHPDGALRRTAIESIGLLNVRPRETFETLADFVATDIFPEACVPSICNISSEFWTEPFRLPLADGLVRSIARLPMTARTTPEAKQAVKLIRTIAHLLPSEQAAPLLRDLSATMVQEIRIRTIKEKMAYDQSVLVVRAGQAVQLTFENDDVMPHNLVVVDSPAARETVGIGADRMQNEPDALSRGYLPESPHILHATKLAYPGQTDVLTFVAPSDPCTLAYVCTFPGHWSKMYGAIKIVDDVDAYLTAHNTVPSADALLGIRTVQWKFEQLVASLSRVSTGRSYDQGEKNYLKASCFACHQMRGQGGRIGPDLTKIRETYKTSEELLLHVMSPSEKVEERYATVVVQTKDGQVLRGVFLDESASELRISPNPLDLCAPIVISKDNVENLSRSRLSPMPEGLLNSLVDAEDVLDLLAYVISGGDRDHELYR